MQSIITEEEEDLPKTARLTKEEIEMVKLVTFCFAANRFFHEGSEAARSAVDELQEFRIPGFKVGSTVFEGRNRNVMMGDLLAGELTGTFEGSPFLQIILSSPTMTHLIHNASRRIRHERRMG